MSHSCCSPSHDHDGHNHASGPDLLLWGSAVVVVLLYALHLLNLNAPLWLHHMAHSTYEFTNAMWWGVVLGILAMGALSKVPREFVVSALGRGGTVKGLWRATAAGVLLDLCSHGILMVGAKLYERGASAGQVIAFLLASPWNSFSLTLILVALVGLPLTLAFIALSMAIALLTGWIFDLLVARGTLPPNPNRVDIPADFHFRKEAKKRLKATRYSPRLFKEMLVSGLLDSRMVLRWLLFGILLAAGLRTLLNPETFQQYFGPTLIGLGATLFFATLLEVCSEGSAPIATDLVTRAQAPGNGFAFLMAGVATDYTEIMVMKEATKSWKIALFIPLITVPQVILLAWLINAFVTV